MVFVFVRRGGGPKAIILSDEHFDALAEGLPKLRRAMCCGKHDCGSEFKSGFFRLNVTRSRRMARLYSDTQYISLTLQGIECLSRMFNVVQEQLRDYIVPILDVLSYVTTILNSVTYVDPAPNAIKTLITHNCRRKSLHSCNPTVYCK